MEIRLPNLGEDTESGTVASIFVAEGDEVSEDQAIIELESEKAVASIPSPAAGRITRIHVREGEEVRTGALLATLEESGSRSATPGPSAPQSGREGMPFPPTEPRLGPVATKPASPRPATEASPTVPEGLSVAASPTIRRMARDLGIDLARIRGTARGGRIVLGDLRDYIARLEELAAPGSDSPRFRAAAPAVDFTRWGEVETVPASATRKTIARRMVESWTRVPHVTQFIHADISRISELRRKWRPGYEAKGARLTLTPILLRALVTVLPRHPFLNSSLDEGSSTIVTKQYYHLGIAVDAEAGLVVPVIRDADRKSLFEMARAVESLSERARQKQLSRDDLEGGTFTVSNQGGIGGEHFTPIINYPEVAILGVGRGRRVPELVDGTLENKPMLPLSLSHDHRVVDGADGVRFLIDLVDAIEQMPEAEFELD